MQMMDSEASRTGVLSRTGGIRESRRYFSLAQPSLAVPPDEQETQEDPLLDLEREFYDIYLLG